MGVRTEWQADAEDIAPLPADRQCRVWIALAAETLAELAGLPETPRRAARRAQAERTLAHNTARLRELMETKHAA